MARKVKTGCRTCKTRKVKCDEDWPACRRCRSSGRECDGYGIWGGGSRVSNSGGKAQASRSNPAATPSRSLAPVTLQNGEQACFEWYMHRTAVKLSGVFPSEYWKMVLLQASMAEPAVRHALLAMSSAHKEEVSGAHAPGVVYYSEQSLFTMSQYSKAITHVKHYSSNSKIPTRVVLITCILFFTTEFLRGQYATGLLHLESGLRLLHSVVFEDEGDDPRIVGIDGWLITMFTRSLVQAKLFGQTSVFGGSYIDLGIRMEYDDFASTHQARRLLEHIQLRALDIRDRSCQLQYDSDRATEARLRGEQKQLVVALQLWFDVCQRTTDKLPRSPTLDFFAYTILKLYYHLTCILVGVCLEPTNELLHDSFDAVYERIVSQCTETYTLLYKTAPFENFDARDHRDPELTSPNSTSDIGWISPLFYTAVKCRNHDLRHNALALLQKSSHKEGIWNSCLAVIIAKEVIKVEESTDYLESIDEYDPLGMNWTFDPCSKLPLHRRISSITVSFPADRVGNLHLNYCHSNGSRTDRDYDLLSKRWTDAPA